eukprot:NODE_261_length_11439_cov_1.285538.p7 type:complete len:213 gc:universal NODE_261_length_11439_cov_1.285538:5430-6068(+)
MLLFHFIMAQSVAAGETRQVTTYSTKDNIKSFYNELSLLAKISHVDLNRLKKCLPDKGIGCINHLDKWIQLIVDHKTESNQLLTEMVVIVKSNQITDSEYGKSVEDALNRNIFECEIPQNRLKKRDGCFNTDLMAKLIQLGFVFIGSAAFLGLLIRGLLDIFGVHATSLSQAVGGGKVVAGIVIIICVLAYATNIRRTSRQTDESDGTQSPA